MRRMYNVHDDYEKYNVFDADDDVKDDADDDFKNDENDDFRDDADHEADRDHGDGLGVIAWDVV